MEKIKKFISLIFILGILALLLDSCGEQLTENAKIEEVNLLYKNHADSAKYIGAQECRKCHQSIYESYSQTQMGKSLSKANLNNSSANFHNQKPVYDEFKNMYYQPFSKGDKLFLREFRLAKNNKDTVHNRVEEISYIIGSGQHTNSHLMHNNGFINQMPLTFYTQKGKWHLPPGFENGGNTSFDRKIEVECMTCHNGFAEHVDGSKNKYSYIPEGIDCERCHGPGSIHKSEKMAGNIVDISKEIDYSIVNPKKLSADLQMDVCQRCHLQGVSVLKDGKSFYDFKPGMKLNLFFEVYQSRFTDSLSSFLMASHPDRLRMSKCFVESNKTDYGLTCITCHNPHVNVKDVDKAYFNSKCISCHNEVRCKETENERNKFEDNCIACHMSKSATYDIPHVNITDHKISRIPIVRDYTKQDVTKSELEKQKDFIKLVCRTSTESNDKLNAKAYLNYFEKYAPNPDLLNTAEDYLKSYKNQNELLNLYVRLYFLKSDFEKVEQYSKSIAPHLVKDKWTAYRIGQSLFNLKKYNESILFLERAVELAPLDIDFMQKLASNYTALKQFDNAEKILKKAIYLFPKNASIQNDYGYILVLNSGGNENKFLSSEQYFTNALDLDPDLITALENITSFYLNIGDKVNSQKCLRRLLDQSNNSGKYERLKEVIKDL